MSEVLEIDPSKGFVAIPAQILDLEISPGAFRALIHLCNLADETGFCWPSLEQLGESMGRSKAAVSGYIQNLREAGVIQTFTQKMASGYNYRLKVKVLFWADWVKTRSRKKIKPVQEGECSVHHVDRPATQKNKTYKTQTTPAGLPTGEVKSIYERWRHLTHGVPFGQFRAQPDNKLIKDTQRLISIYRPDDKPDVTAVTSQLRSLWQRLSVTASEADIAEQSYAILKSGITKKGVACLVAKFLETWKPFWKKPPTPLQFEAMISNAKSEHPEDAMVRIIALDFGKWTKSQLPTKGFEVAA